MAVALAAMIPSVGGQPRSAAKPANKPPLTLVQSLPLTCVQAWVASKKNYAQLLPVVTALAKLSLANRELTFPNDGEVGRDVGRGIAEDCKADPNALLFAIVDKHVRRVARPARG